MSDECFYPQIQTTTIVDAAGKEQRVSTESGSTVEWQEEENYKFRLSEFQQVLEAHYTRNAGAIYPPQHHEAILNQLRAAPLQDLSVSRPSSRLSWGIPVPDDDSHTIYVWIDALTVYLSSIGFPWANREKMLVSGWPSDIQVIGKDILRSVPFSHPPLSRSLISSRFHAIYFPAMLAALGLPFPQKLLAHSHWTMDHRKMSKSLGNVVDPIAAIDVYGIDVVRYYLAEVGGKFKDDVGERRPRLSMCITCSH